MFQNDKKRLALLHVLKILDTPNAGSNDVLKILDTQTRVGFCLSGVIFLKMDVRKTLLIVLEHTRRNVFAGYPYSNLHTALMLIVPKVEVIYVGSYYFRAVDDKWYGRKFCKKHRFCVKTRLLSYDGIVDDEDVLLEYMANAECTSCLYENLPKRWKLRETPQRKK